MPSAAYTSDELLQMLRDRQGGLTQLQYAEEIGISFQMLSQVYKGERSVGCERILAYLAPKGKRFVEEKVWHLINK
jgi:transcriptional regulator with XRE-family HTH domain